MINFAKKFMHIEKINYNLNMKRSSSSMKYAKNEITSYFHSRLKYLTEMWKISNLGNQI